MRSPQAPLHAPRATSDVDTQGSPAWATSRNSTAGSARSPPSRRASPSSRSSPRSSSCSDSASRTGGAAFFWAWPLVFGGQLLVALNFAQLAARWPISGAIFQWSSRLARPVRVVHRLDDDHRPDPHRRGGGHRRAGRAPRDLGRVPGRRRSGSGPVRRVADRCRERGGPRSGDARRDDDREHHERPADGPRDELRRAHRDRRRGRAHRRAVPAAAPQRVRGVHDRRVDEHRAVRVGVPGVLADGRVRDGRLRLGR